MSQQELRFELIEKVVKQGEKRLETMFRQTFEDLDKLSAQGLSPEQEQAREHVVDAYKLAKELVFTLVQFKTALHRRHTP
jgi:hypothetical protein